MRAFRREKPSRECRHEKLKPLFLAEAREVFRYNL